MEFYEYPPLWRYFRSLESELKHKVGSLTYNELKDPTLFYKNILKTIELHPDVITQFGFQSRNHDKIVYNQACSECFWFKNEQKYYRVHPKIVEIFSEARMESIPCSMLDFEVDKPFAVLLSKENILKIDENHELQSVLVHRTIVDQLNQLTLWIDFGETHTDVITRFPVPLLSFKTIKWQTGEETIDSVFESLPPEIESASLGVQLKREFLIKVLRLVCSVHFLIKNESPLIEPDVLSKDLRDYYSSNEKEQFAQKAWKKRGKKGWKVGTERSFSLGLLPAPPIKSSSNSESEGKELSFAHIRKPHWHLVRHGKGKSQAKVIWYFPTVVRPDLPFRA